MIFYVYIVQQTGTGLVKIGRTANFEGRLKTLNTSSSSNLLTVRLFEYQKRSQTVLVEKYLHLTCADLRLSGEWFMHECLKRINGRIDPVMAFRWLFANGHKKMPRSKDIVHPITGQLMHVSIVRNIIRGGLQNLQSERRNENAP